MNACVRCAYPDYPLFAFLADAVPFFDTPTKRLGHTLTS